jgi:hypothetical protein
VKKRWAKDAEGDKSQHHDVKGENRSGNTEVDTGSIPKKPEARESSEANASGAPVPDGPDAEAWQRAVKVLMGSGKLSEKNARSFFGKLLKEYALSARDLLLVVVKCELNGTQDPQSYLRAASGAISERARKASDNVDRNVLKWDEDTWRHFVAKWRANPENWGDRMGPKPGEPGCLCPPHLLVEPVAA